MLFVTNRMPRQSYRTRMNRPISFDYNNTTVSQNLFFCQRSGADDYVEIGNRAFFSRLKDLPGRTQVLLYIHGFNNNMEPDIFGRAERLQALLDAEGGPELAHVVPLVWPCDDDSPAQMLDDYWDDQRAADASGPAFGRLMGKFDQWRQREAVGGDPCMRRINLISHSMGNRVLQNALAAWVDGDGHGEMPQIFRNVFMVAADVVNHTLEPGERGQHIPYAARNVVVYYASDDLAMPASKVANLKNRTVSRRLGMTGPEDLDAVPRNVYEVDCDEFNNSLDAPTGHAYFLESRTGVVSPVLVHMAAAMKNARVSPDQRHHRLARPEGL